MQPRSRLRKRDYEISNSPKTTESKRYNPLKLSIVKQEIKGPSVANRKDSYLLE